MASEFSTGIQFATTIAERYGESSAQKCYKFFFQGKRQENIADCETPTAVANTADSSAVALFVWKGPLG